MIAINHSKGTRKCPNILGASLCRLLHYLGNIIGEGSLERSDPSLQHLFIKSSIILGIHLSSLALWEHFRISFSPRLDARRHPTTHFAFLYVCLTINCQQCQIPLPWAGNIAECESSVFVIWNVTMYFKIACSNDKDFALWILKSRQCHLPE